MPNATIRLVLDDLDLVLELVLEFHVSGIGSVDDHLQVAQARHHRFSRNCLYETRTKQGTPCMMTLFMKLHVLFSSCASFTARSSPVCWSIAWYTVPDVAGIRPMGTAGEPLGAYYHSHFWVLEVNAMMTWTQNRLLHQSLQVLL